MISFKGELSNAAKAFVKRKHVKTAIILSTIESIIFSIPVILLGIFWHPVIFIFFLVVAGIPFLNFACLVWELSYQTQIDFENGVFYTYYTKKNTTEQTYGGGRDIADVKAVIDYGEFYYIEIYTKLSSYVCQKSLLVEGSIEEFEELFADRLIKKGL